MVIIFVAGCSSRSPVTSGIGTSAIHNTNEFSRYLKTDNPKMADLLSIAQVQSRLINGVTQVNVELVSGASKTQKLQYQFTWFDEQGFVVEPNKTPWTPLSLHGGQIKKLRAVAPNATATTFSVYVRRAHSKAYEFEKE